MIQTLIAIGMILFIAGLLSIGPALLLLTPHPTRGTLTAQRHLRRAAFALHLLAIVAAAFLLAPPSETHGTGNQAATPESTTDGAAQTDFSDGAPAGETSGSAGGRSASDEVPRVAQADVASSGGTRGLEIRQPAVDRAQTPAHAGSSASAVQTGGIDQTAPALRFGLIDPGSITYLGWRSRAFGVARAAGLVAIIGAGAAALMVVMLWLVDRRRERMLQQGAVRRRVGRCTFIVSAGVRTPGSVGLLRPRIYLPVAVMDKATQRRAVVAHELHHARRLDAVRLAADILLQVLFWWSPAAHAIAARGRTLREMAADQTAARRTGERTYRWTLVDVAELAQRMRRQAAPALCAVLGTNMAAGEIESRLRRVLGTRGRRRRPAAWAAATAVALAVSLSVGACTSIGPEPTYQGLPLDDYWITEYEDDDVSHTTRFYNADGRLTSRTVTVWEGPDGIVVATTFDADGNQIRRQEMEYVRSLYRYPDAVQNPNNSIGPYIFSSSGSAIDSDVRSASSTNSEGFRSHHTTHYTYPIQTESIRTFESRRLNVMIDETDDSGRTTRMGQQAIDGNPVGRINEYEYEGEALVKSTLRNADGTIVSITEIERGENGEVIERRSGDGAGLRSITRYHYEEDRVISYRYTAVDTDRAPVSFGSGRFPHISGPGSTGDDKWVSLYRDEASGFAVDIHADHLGIASDQELRHYVRDILIEFLHHRPTLISAYAYHVFERGAVSGRITRTYTNNRDITPILRNTSSGALAIVSDKLAYAVAEWSLSDALFQGKPLFRLTIPLELIVDERGATVMVDVPEPEPVYPRTDFTLLPDNLIVDDRAALSVGVRVQPDGTILDPYIRSWEGPEPTREEELAIVDALWGTQLEPTGFDEPVTVVISRRRWPPGHPAPVGTWDNPLGVVLWAPDPAVEAWLRTEPWAQR